MYADMQIWVETCGDYYGVEMPRRFRLGKREVDILDNLDQWRGSGYLSFKVRDKDGNLYILHFDEIRTGWELMMFQRARSQGADRSLKQVLSNVLGLECNLFPGNTIIHSTSIESARPPSSVRCARAADIRNKGSGDNLPACQNRWCCERIGCKRRFSPNSRHQRHPDKLLEACGIRFF
jgi:hypothetical protein